MKLFIGYVIFLTFVIVALIGHGGEAGETGITLAVIYGGGSLVYLFFYWAINGTSKSNKNSDSKK